MQTIDLLQLAAGIAIAGLGWCIRHFGGPAFLAAPGSPAAPAAPAFPIAPAAPSASGTLSLLSQLLSKAQVEHELQLLLASLQAQGTGAHTDPVQLSPAPAAAVAPAK